MSASADRSSYTHCLVTSASRLSVHERGRCLPTAHDAIEPLTSLSPPALALELRPPSRPFAYRPLLVSEVALRVESGQAAKANIIADV
jgi:hypothetical protein